MRRECKRRARKRAGARGQVGGESGFVGRDQAGSLGARERRGIVENERWFS